MFICRELVVCVWEVLKWGISMQELYPHPQSPKRGIPLLEHVNHAARTAAVFPEIRLEEG